MNFAYDRPCPLIRAARDPFPKDWLPVVCGFPEDIPLKLSAIGWSAPVAEAFQPFYVRGFVPGRVARQERGAWEVWTEGGAAAVEHVRSGLAPLVGDWVALRPSRDSIEGILPRLSVLRRRAAGNDAEEQVLASNADVAMIVMGLDGDYNPRRLERYLAIVRAGGVRPVVLLNKRDLCVNAPARVVQTADIAPGVDVYTISALEDDVPGLLGALCEHGQTGVLLGSSGAGKSTITNRLLGHGEQATCVVREHDSRGRHTTTARRLVLLPQGWLLMDMPGLREVGLVDGCEALDSVFSDIEALAGSCRFRDCTHSGEPGCAVAGHAGQDRLDAWQKLRRELRDPRERKREERVIHRAVRQIDRIRGFSKE